jgi:hypothetical protein
LHSLTLRCGHEGRVPAGDQPDVAVLHEEVQKSVTRTQEWKWQQDVERLTREYMSKGGAAAVAEAVQRLQDKRKAQRVEVCSS